MKNKLLAAAALAVAGVAASCAPALAHDQGGLPPHAQGAAGTAATGEACADSLHWDGLMKSLMHDGAACAPGTAAHAGTGHHHSTRPVATHTPAADDEDCPPTKPPTTPPVTPPVPPPPTQQPTTPPTNPPTQPPVSTPPATPPVSSPPASETPGTPPVTTPSTPVAAQLAHTGSSGTTLLGGIAVVLAGAGGGAVLAARRRRQA